MHWLKFFNHTKLGLELKQALIEFFSVAAIVRQSVEDNDFNHA